MNSLKLFPSFRDVLELTYFFRGYISSLLKQNYEEELSLKTGISFTLYSG